jgi:hypothetical protein
MSPAADHTDVAAYAFGALEEADRLAFQEHLETCPSCAAELAELGGMKDLFSTLKQQTDLEDLEDFAEAAPETSSEAVGKNVVDLLQHRKRAVRRQRRGTAILTAAAAAAVPAGGIVIGTATAGHRQAPVGMPGMTNGPANILEMVGEKHSASDPATGASGTVALMSLKWGTHVALQLTKVKGPLDCQLVAVSKNGTERVVTGWAVPPTGYGTAQNPASLVVHGGTSIMRSQLDHFDIRITGGGNLLTVPV